MDRANIVHQNFLDRVSAEDFPDGKAPTGPITSQQAITIFRTGCLTRALDRKSREMQAQGQGFYTIGSSGHEGIAAIAAALRLGDMAFLHYRDAAFQIQRSEMVPGQSITWDMLLSFACAKEDPISGGRHKVLGSKKLNIPPQTSTIASHLPKAVGAAYSIGLTKKVAPEHQCLKDDAIVICSFGDASVNHSTAQGAFNTAQWTSYQGIPLSLLFVCEDNGIGISTKTPKGWVAASFKNREGIKYFHCDGLDIFETYKVASEAAAYIRKTRKPAFLHIRTVRLYGHAGADIQTVYMDRSEVEADEANDPLLHSVRLLNEAGFLPPSKSLEIYKTTTDRVASVASQVIKRPRLSSAEEVMKSIIPPTRPCRQSNGPTPKERADLFGKEANAMENPQIMSRLINWALKDLMLEHDEVVMMGQDIGVKGGVYGVTRGLHDNFGARRMIDTLLDEQSILGLSIGMAHNGFTPIPEIQFLAYYHNAEDQIRGEAATLSFFSNGQFTNPMVIRIAGLGYQKGFGGHFHNDNSLAVLRDVPGVILACPSNGADAAKMLRESVRLAREEQRIVVFLEPIALYATKDLHDVGDGGWMQTYPDASERIALGDVGIHGDGKDLAIISYANGCYLSLKAQKKLADKGINARVIDLRWLTPLPKEKMLEAIGSCKHVLIVDETRRSGGVSESIMTCLAENIQVPFERLASEDSFIPTGPAYASTMPSQDSIINAALKLIGEDK
ncbi:MAG: thiamine pyrophosphate-dependent enzyme [Emcibacteraceae bacterium]|nr:thiamine pyrophosphate-dependent enzyme [Emcibacteraceae bacterium]MDG1726623.1 thiamine pyrophosphate-dependent enzyme [Emcibacteraceae bacterium]